VVADLSSGDVGADGLNLVELMHGKFTAAHLEWWGALWQLSNMKEWSRGRGVRVMYGRVSGVIVHGDNCQIQPTV